jgi:hypothetical protein
MKLITRKAVASVASSGDRGKAFWRRAIPERNCATTEMNVPRIEAIIAVAAVGPPSRCGELRIGKFRLPEGAKRTTARDPAAETASELEPHADAVLVSHRTLPTWKRSNEGAEKDADDACEELRRPPRVKSPAVFVAPPESVPPRKNRTMTARADAVKNMRQDLPGFSEARGDMILYNERVGRQEVFVCFIEPGWYCFFSRFSVFLSFQDLKRGLRCRRESIPSKRDGCGRLR